MANLSKIRIRGVVHNIVDGVARNGISTLNTIVSSLSTSISTVDGKANTNSSNISSLSSRVGTNESNISSLTSRVGTAEGNISTINGNVSSLSSSVSTNTSNINKCYLPVGTCIINNTWNIANGGFSYGTWKYIGTVNYYREDTTYKDSKYLWQRIS